MEVEVFVHGTPHGESFWGKEEDRMFFGSFYTQTCSDEVKFLIQTRLTMGKSYCYYSYLLYKNVIESGGRAGSYFGLTIRMDAYCKDFMRVYKILNMVFSAYVLNKVLKPLAVGYKYVVSNFPDSLELMDNISEGTLRLIQATFEKTPEDFCSFNGFSTNKTYRNSANLYEITADAVESLLREDGAIALSPYYQTSKERQAEEKYQERLQEVKEKYEARLQQGAKEKDKVDASLSSVRSECNRLKGDLSDKQKEIDSNKKKINSAEQVRKSSEIIERIKEPIIELAGIFGGPQKPKEPPRPQESLSWIKVIKSFMPLVNFFLLLIVLASLFPKCTSDHQAGSDVSPKGNETQDTVDVSSDSTAHSASTPDYSGWGIDVAGYNDNNPLQPRRAYQATFVKNKNNKEDCLPNKCNWEIKGGTIDCVTFTVDGTMDPVVLTAYDQDGNKIQERELKVKK